MNLLKYVEEMKSLPERFTNLGFWRGCRRFKDSVVNALEYIDSWGEHVESLLPIETPIKSSSYKVPDLASYANIFRLNCLTVRSISDTAIDILPCLTILPSSLRLHITDVVAGKRIDCVIVSYVTSDNIFLNFTLPNGYYITGTEPSGQTVQGYRVFGNGTCLSAVLRINPNDLPKYETMTIYSITAYYH